MLAVVLDSYSDVKARWTVSLPVRHELASVVKLARDRMRQGEGLPHPM